MNKQEVLKNLFQLHQEDILDIGKIINGYEERIHKSQKDTLLMRCVFMAGYHCTKEFYVENGLTKDGILANSLNYETTNLKAYLKLKEILNIDAELFLHIMKEFEEKQNERISFSNR